MGPTIVIVFPDNRKRVREACSARYAGIEAVETCCTQRRTLRDRVVRVAGGYSVCHPTVIRPSNSGADRDSLVIPAETTVSWAVAEGAVPDDHVGTAGSRGRSDRLVHHDCKSSNDSDDDGYDPYDDPELLALRLSGF